MASQQSQTSPTASLAFTSRFTAINKIHIICPSLQFSYSCKSFPDIYHRSLNCLDRTTSRETAIPRCFVAFAIDIVSMTHRHVRLLPRRYTSQASLPSHPPRQNNSASHFLICFRSGLQPSNASMVYVTYLQSWWRHYKSLPYPHLAATFFQSESK